MMATITQAQASGSITPPVTFLFQGCGDPSNKAETICSCMFSKAVDSYSNLQFAYTSPTTATCYYQNIDNGWWYGGTISGWLVPSCPSNSIWDGSINACYCIDPSIANAARTRCVPPPCEPGYQLDPTGTICIPDNNCPANMSGIPCACNSGYVPNPAGEGCILEQYIISIIKNSDSEVEPGASREVVVQVLSASTREPKSDVTVNLKVDVESNTGGHKHHDEQRPKGILTGAVGCDTPESTCSAATTASNGRASFSFSAPKVAGTHTVTATCVSLACTGTDKDNINVKVPGLEQIPDSPLYVLIKKPGATHGNGHFLTPEAATVLQDMASSYYLEYLFVQKKYAFTGGGWGQLTFTPSKLHVNDASLVWGGRFDFKGNWGSPHAGHQRGVVIDVRANESEGAIPLTSFANFKKRAASYGAVAQVHCTSNKTDGQNRKPQTACVGNDGSQDSNRHFHILLLGVDQ